MVPEHLLPKEYKKQPNASLNSLSSSSSGDFGNAVSFTRPDDIVWSDPDDPYNEKGSAELDTILAKKVKGPWEVSFTEARKLAKQKEKPLLIWFTNTKTSPTCKHLSAELFATAGFESWTKEHLIKLRVDLFVSDPLSKEGSRKDDWLEKLKKRYSVKGTPVVLVLTPNQEVISRYRGYKIGNSDFYFGRIKSAKDIANRNYSDWKHGLQAKGYREWTGKKGVKIFAKLARYKEGKLILVEPDGKRFRTTESKLSVKDRQWIAAEKAKREKTL